MPTPVEIAVHTYIRACCARDPVVRAELLEASLAPDVRMVTGGREIRGRAVLIQELTRFLADPKLLRIRLLSVVDARGTIFRYRAAADMQDGTSPEAFDAGQIDADGRISLILTFNGPLADAQQ
jgi:hypothetical protein